MTTSTLALPNRRKWFVLVAVAGVAWNAFGIVQFIGSLSQTQHSLMASGLTADQAAIYASLPSWMSLAFAVGTIGGLAGSLALAVRPSLARPILGLSLAAYVLLFGGDLYHGVFSAIPSQLAIITLVVAIAAGLLWTSDRLMREDHSA